LAKLGVTKPDTQVWLFEDSAGIWLLLHADVNQGGHISDVLRIDYDIQGVVGGISPGVMNWDAEMRYSDCGVDMNDPQMRTIQAAGSAQELAEIVASWFVRNVGDLLGQPKKF
jgi:hypothetical protein